MLKFKNLKFGQETLLQVIHSSISTDLPQCINDLHALILIVKKFKMNFKKILSIQTVCVLLSFLVM
jgi:hypothetical protein